ncbi:MAG: HAD family hydrolase [Nitrososphaeria archaeon]
MEIREALAVIFDLDGTLVRLPIDYMALREELKRLASKYGVCSEFRPIIGEVSRLAELLAEGAKFVQECTAVIDYYEDKAAEIVEPVRGAKDCLSLLKSKGKKIGVVSNNSTPSVKKALRNAELLEYVDAYIGREGLKVKPDPYPVVKVIDSLNIKRENVIMIGNSELDFMAAERAKIRAYVFKGGDLCAFVQSIENL